MLINRFLEFASPYFPHKSDAIERLPGAVIEDDVLIATNLDAGRLLFPPGGRDVPSRSYIAETQALPEIDNWPVLGFMDPFGRDIHLRIPRNSHCFLVFAFSATRRSFCVLLRK